MTRPLDHIDVKTLSSQFSVYEKDRKLLEYLQFIIFENMEKFSKTELETLLADLAQARQFLENIQRLMFLGNIKEYKVAHEQWPAQLVNILHKYSKYLNAYKNCKIAKKKELCSTEKCEWSKIPFRGCIPKYPSALTPKEWCSLGEGQGGIYPTFCYNKGICEPGYWSNKCQYNAKTKERILKWFKTHRYPDALDRLLTTTPNQEVGQEVEQRRVPENVNPQVEGEFEE